MTERAVHPRSTCCIPGCPRWSRKFAPDVEWMCGRAHWRRVPRRIRRAFSKVEQRLDDIASLTSSGGRWTPELVRQWDRACLLLDRLWGHAKRRVILHEAGL